MAISLVGSPVIANNAAAAGTSYTVTLTGTTAGNQVVLLLLWDSNISSADEISSITCSGETVVLHGSTVMNSASQRKARIASVAQLASGGSKVFTLTFTHGWSSDAGRNAVVAMEFTGGDPANWFDNVQTTTGSGADPSVSITTANANSLIVGGVINTSPPPTAGSGYTSVGTISGTSASKFGEYDVDAGTAGTKTVDFVTANSLGWALVAAAFNAQPSSFAKTPTVGALSLTGYAPTVGGDRSATPSVGSVSLTGYAPAVSTSMSPTLAPGVATVSVTGLAPTVTTGGIGVVSVDLLTHTISSEGYGGPVVSTDLLAHTLSASGESGAYATASNTLLSIELSAGGNETASLTLLVHESLATGVAGAIGALEATLLDQTLSADGLVHGVGTAANDLLYHSSDASALGGNTGELAGTLALHRIETVAYGGDVGTASVSLLLHTASAGGFAAITGSAAVTLVGHYLEASGFATLAETYRAWVLNLRNQALTEYDNFEFNSFAYFDGKYLAAGPGGIVELGTQDVDGSDVIHWRVRTGSVDYGSTYLKRVPRLYVTGEFSGSAYFRTITSEDGERTYLLPDNGIRGDQQRRVPIGKGPKSLQWAYEIEDTNGEDMRVSRIMPYPQELGRRIA